MTQTVTPQSPVPSLRAPGLRPVSAWAFKPVLAVHGADPETNMPTTWHVSALAADDPSGCYLIERADGDIHSPALWMQAQHRASVAGEVEVMKLVRSVLFSGPCAPSE